MTRTPTLQDIRRNVATPWNLPQAPEGTIHPEPVRRALAHAYADLQILKLKVVIGLVALVALKHFVFPIH